MPEWEIPAESAPERDNVTIQTSAIVWPLFPAHRIGSLVHLSSLSVSQNVNFLRFHVSRNRPFFLICVILFLATVVFHSDSV